MTLNQEEVSKIASLARIKISIEETQQLASELSAVVDFVETLNQASTSNEVKLETRGNVMRSDNIVESLPVQKVLQNAPGKSGNYILVKKVFE